MPIEPISSPMPTDDRFRLDNEERILPARPGRPQDCPEEPIQKAQSRPRPFPLQNGHLLTKGANVFSAIFRSLNLTRTYAAASSCGGTALSLSIRARLGLRPNDREILSDAQESPK